MGRSKVKGNGKVHVIIASKFSVVLVSGGSGEIRGETIPSLPAAPVAGDEERPSVLNPWSQRGTHSEDSALVVSVVLQCSQYLPSKGEKYIPMTLNLVLRIYI